MTSQPEHAEKSATPDSEKLPEPKPADDIAPASKAGLPGLKLNLVANYAKRGFAPVVAVVALVIAVTAVIGNQSSQAQIRKADAKLTSMSASLSSYKGELAKLRAARLKEKAVQAEERKKQNEGETIIVQNITRLQVKMKISPTLEEQLRQPVSSTAVTPSVASAAAVTVAASADTGKKPDPKVQAIKESIEKFNQK